MASRRHVFISHHHADDEHVTKLTDSLSRKGYEIRNSSIRAKPANKERLAKGLVSDNAIKRLLRIKMAWASTVIVLIGKDTHARPWVNWEIKKAHELGKRIVGVFTRGGTKADIPPPFEDYGSTLVNWNPDAVIDAVEGSDNDFQNTDGSSRPPVHVPSTSRC
ncbi:MULTISPECIES: TIR domain-containing protein [unclassified Ochrobactrum]|uniref:TIR domain-containing protein n=1 Tax=unclassified Ochrobactrum TaxID=239106 RepID=UPI000DEFC893|nr:MULTISPECIES: TIR domain-containing protein [unclassified Ochrobactrum]MBQ0711265.1 TIR domain-containing protein [Ochrobactrum sp. AP1BH01-1]